MPSTVYSKTQIDDLRAQDSATYLTRNAFVADKASASLLLAPAPAAPAILAGDDFTGATGSIVGRLSNKGAFGQWTVPYGSFTASSGVVTVATPATDAQIAVLPLALSTLYSVSGVLTTATTSATVKSMPGLVFRYQDAGNYWYCTITATPNGSGYGKEGYVNLYRVRSGLTVRRAAIQVLPTGLTISDASSHTVRIDIEGSDIGITVDGYPLGTFPEYDVNPAAASVGFFCSAVGAPTISATFRALTVTAYADARFNWPRVETPIPVTSFTPYLFAGDDFTGTAGELVGRVADLGAANAWTGTTGQWALDGKGNLVPNVATDGILAILADTAAPATTPRTYQFTAISNGSSSTVKSMPGIVFRYADASNFWYCYIDATNSGGALYLRKKVAGADTLVTNIGGQGITFGAAVTLQVSDDGTNIAVSIPGGPAILTASDTALNTNSKVGIRQGLAGAPTALMSVPDFRVLQKPVPPTWPTDPSTQILSLGTSGAWDSTDINNPQVVWDPTNQQWVCYYSGFLSGAPEQQMGLAYAKTLAGPWTKDSANPIGISTLDGQNGSLCYKDGTWYHATVLSGSVIGLWTSTDLHTWTQGAQVAASGQDPFIRVTQSGNLEVWYGIGYPNAQIYRTTSTDNAATWSTPQVIISAPPGWAQFGGNAEPSVWVPQGRESQQYLVFCDASDFIYTSNAHRNIMCAISVDGGATWRWRRLLMGSGTGWDLDGKFDSFPLYAEGAFHLFHSGAAVPGLVLNMGIQIGHAAAQWSPLNSVAAKSN